MAEVGGSEQESETGERNVLSNHHQQNFTLWSVELVNIET